MFHETFKIHMKHLDENATSKNTCNISAKHMQPVKHMQYCNIFLKHLKHVEYTLVMCSKTCLMPAMDAAPNSSVDQRGGSHEERRPMAGRAAGELRP